MTFGDEAQRDRNGTALEERVAAEAEPFHVLVREIHFLFGEEPFLLFRGEQEFGERKRVFGREDRLFEHRRQLP